MSDCLICVLKDIRNVSHDRGRRLEAAESLLENLEDIIDFLSAFDFVEREMYSIHELVSRPYAGSLDTMMQRVELRSARAIARMKELD